MIEHVLFVEYVQQKYGNYRMNFIQIFRNFLGFKWRKKELQNIKYFFYHFESLKKIKNKIYLLKNKVFELFLNLK